MLSLADLSELVLAVVELVAAVAVEYQLLLIELFFEMEIFVVSFG